MATDWVKASVAADRALIGIVWPDGSILGDDALAVYLAAAKAGCVAYAPTLAEGADVPEEYRLAHIMHARNIFNAGNAASDGNGELSAGGYGITSYPLDWHVKQLLRPQRGEGAIW
ncbi:hypothetical protein [Microbacterium sp. RG1]|uniref:hypothetical protein n=1 Tax=Microbacterium sp. RG1 TaxID=2489212 RepID=UPI0010CA25BB|nr:hypothetical protein [Microbacterium sp. RG1]QCQ16990.1 hypothetical protein EHF32_09810 [Microbacterium sp. RG1]